MSAKPTYKASRDEIVKALCSIENWIKGVRKVVAQLPEDMEIELSRHLPNFTSGGNIPYVKGCPPPDIYVNDGGMVDVKNCPPPEWYQEPCPWDR